MASLPDDPALPDAAAGAARLRLGVLDIGSNSAHLRIADLAPGEPPVPVRSVKSAVRLAESTDRHGVIGRPAVGRLIGAVREASAAASAAGVGELLPLATSALRDATNRDDVAAEVRAATGVELGFLSGEEEARLTFLAVRRWYGWSAGPLLLADIGGGSMELAYGAGDEPETALSLPLGAGRLTRHHLPGRPPVRKRTRKALRAHVRSVLDEATTGLAERPAPVRAVATSKTFTQLARLCGAPKAKAGPYAPRTLARPDLHGWIPKLAKLPDEERARLRGVKRSRAHQILAGAIVAEAVMDVLGLDRLDVCPWALREGIFLHRLDALAAGRPAGPPFGTVGDGAGAPYPCPVPVRPPQPGAGRAAAARLHAVGSG
ncbi:Ppx/GppA phosphatase family protein [Actinomadura verrucosospora]|uniref:Ppx/GppA phosphatase n=1 Tax=Actinomadura verrucosospora TaxID=46165 RepID=A0A7D3VYX2_ACTVE|nr:Ppx/GppA family phosphatase [Actinomadura verrucosospora]QKG26820.1 Ppx/GppA phosphatase [Actinomadura verrucosospora]